jgi:hypothetical protein
MPRRLVVKEDGAASGTKPKGKRNDEVRLGNAEGKPEHLSGRGNVTVSSLIIF